MKKILLPLLAFFVINANAQTKRIKLLDKKIGPIDILYQKSVDLENEDSLYLVYLSFQNAKYYRITDIRGIAFLDSSRLTEFINDLKSALKQMELGEKIQMNWSRTIYELDLYDWTKKLSLESKKDGNGYILIDKKIVSKLISTLLSINFGKDELKPE